MGGEGEDNAHDALWKCVGMCVRFLEVSGLVKEY